MRRRNRWKLWQACVYICMLLHMCILPMQTPRPHLSTRTMFYIHGLPYPLLPSLGSTLPRGGGRWGSREKPIFHLKQPVSLQLLCNKQGRCHAFYWPDIFTVQGFHSFLVLCATSYILNTTREEGAQLSQFNIVRWKAPTATMPTYFSTDTLVLYPILA